MKVVREDRRQLTDYKGDDGGGGRIHEANLNSIQALGGREVVKSAPGQAEIFTMEGLFPPLEFMFL